jgi:hypothetical protein
MHSNHSPEIVGNYLVTPLVRRADDSRFAASVSIRRGGYDRILRFMPDFSCDGSARRYALAQGRLLAQGHRHG